MCYFRHESTTTGSETQLEETKETTQTVKDQNERMRNVITTINKWINICHKIVKQSEVDKIELNLPSEDMMSEKGKQTLETNRKKLEDICQLYVFVYILILFYIIHNFYIFLITIQTTVLL